MWLVWPSEYKDLPVELSFYVGLDRKWRKTIQLVWHVGSLGESASIQCLKYTKGSSSKVLYVCILARCNMFPSIASWHRLGMDTFRECCECILQVALKLHLPRSHGLNMWPFHCPFIHNDLWTRPTLHVPDNNGGIVEHCTLVRLIWRHLHQDVKRGESFACITQ